MCSKGRFDYFVSSEIQERVVIIPTGRLGGMPPAQAAVSRMAASVRIVCREIQQMQSERNILRGSIKCVIKLLRTIR